jgi:hypothetical protein
MDAVALAENERTHLGVPAARGMTEMDAGFEKLAHGEAWHSHGFGPFSG